MSELYLKLSEIFSTLEEMTGLEVCVYPTRHSRTMRGSGVNLLPHSYLSHFGEFCRIIKANRTGAGCGGYDSVKTVEKSAQVGKPFVNICHAGLGEVIFPVYGYSKTHIATVFIGQVILDETDEQGFPGILDRIKHLGVDETNLQKAFHRLPRMSREELLRIGKLTDLALRGLGEELDFEAFEHREMLKHYPQINLALQILKETGHSITEAELAEKVKLSQAYFSRLFKKVVKCGFQEYLNRQQIQQATSLLHKTSLSVSEISEKCGFSRQSYFTRKFKSHTGMTPSEFRKRKL